MLSRSVLFLVALFLSVSAPASVTASHLSQSLNGIGRDDVSVNQWIESHTEALSTLSQEDLIRLGGETSELLDPDDCRLKTCGYPFGGLSCSLRLCRGCTAIPGSGGNCF